MKLNPFNRSLTSSTSSLTGKIDAFLSKVNEYSSLQANEARQILSSYLPDLKKVLEDPSLSKFHAEARSFISEINTLLK